MVTKRLKMQGFIISDCMASIAAEFGQNMSQYVLEGKLVVKEKVFEGISSTGAAFVDMMSGGNIGKQVVKVIQEDPFRVK